MNTEIYLIRHGDVDNPDQIIYGRSLDFYLTNKGFEQLEELGTRLKSEGVAPVVIYSSPLKRARQSAEELQRVYNGTPSIEIRDDLQDVSSPGLVGRKIAWLEKIGGDIYNYHGPDRAEMGEIESPEKQVERMKGVIAGILEQHKGETVFVVSHGDPTAFTMWSLTHPDELLPTIAELAKNNYLKKGEAWQIVFNVAGKVVKHGRISRGIDQAREY